MSEDEQRDPLPRDSGLGEATPAEIDRHRGRQRRQGLSDIQQFPEDLGDLQDQPNPFQQRGLERTPPRVQQEAQRDPVQDPQALNDPIDQGQQPVPPRPPTPPTPPPLSPPPSPPPQAPAMADVQGGQLNAIREFDPAKDGADVETWVASVTTAKTAFNWSDAQTASVAKGKLAGQASRWLLNEAEEGTNYNDWPALQAALKDRFKVQLTYQTAATLMSDLTQKHNEDVAVFYDRVRAAVITKNKVVFSAAQRAEAWYRGVLRNDYKTFLLAGLNKEIRARLPQPYPNDVQEILRISMGVEAELKKKFSVSEMSQGMGQPKDAQSLGEALEELSKELAVLRTQALTCWHCQKKGHSKDNCWALHGRPGTQQKKKKKKKSGRKGLSEMTKEKEPGNGSGE